MITKQRFFNIIKDYQKYQKMNDDIAFDYGMDLNCSYQNAMIDSLWSHLMMTNFKEEGIECINWYLDKPNGNDVDPDLYVSLTTHKPITIKTPIELWKYVRNFLIK